MPFTLAHPVLAIPLKKFNSNFSATALIIGSMVPDFRNFLEMRDENYSDHQQWYFILLINIILGLLSCYLFHNLLKNAFIRNLPSWFRKRFCNVLDLNWNSYVADNKLMVLFSLLAGIATHLFWDGFTHHDGFFLEWIPFLSVNIHFMNTSLPVHFILQILSSIVGLLLLLNIVVGREVSIKYMPVKKNDQYYWPVFFMLIFVIVTCRLLIWPELNIYVGIVKAFIGTCFYSWLLISVFFRITDKDKNIKSVHS